MALSRTLPNSEFYVAWIASALRYPCSPQVCFRPLCFSETSTLVPVFTNQKNRKRISLLQNRRWKANTASAFVVQGAITGAAGTPAARVAPPSPCPRNYTQHHSLRPRSSELRPWASGLHLNVLCVSVSNIYPEVTASLCLVSAYKRCHRNALLLDSRGNLQRHTHTHPHIWGLTRKFTSLLHRCC